MSQVANRREMILNGPILKTIVTLSLPLMLGNLAQTLYSLADAYWVGQLSYKHFAAVNFVWPITFVFISIGIGLTVAATSLASQAIGDNEYGKAKDILGQFFTLAVVVGTILSIIGFFFTPYILKLMGAEGDIYRYSVEYLQVAFFELPFLFMFNVYRSMQESQGDTMSPTMLLLISVLINIVLDPILIIYFDMGVRGAALATLISRIALSGYLIKRIFHSDNGTHLIKENLKLKKDVLKNILKIAVPSTTGQFISAFGFIVLNAFVLAYGEETVAAYSLGNRVTNLFMMPAFGVSGALAAFIGQNIGANNTKRAKKAVKVAISFSFSMLVIGSIVTYTFREPLISAFIKDSKEVFALSLNYMSYLRFIFPLMAIFEGFIGVFSGSGHTKYTVILSLSRLWLLRIPMIVLFRKYTDLGSDGVWIAMFISNLVVCMVGFFIVRQGSWLKKTLAI